MPTGLTLGLKLYCVEIYVGERHIGYSSVSFPLVVYILWYINICLDFVCACFAPVSCLNLELRDDIIIDITYIPS